MPDSTLIHNPAAESAEGACGTKVASESTHAVPSLCSESPHLLEPEVLTSRVLIIDDMPAIHADFRKILATNEPDRLAETERALFGSSPSSTSRLTFTLDSAYQGQEGLEMLRGAMAAGQSYALAFVDIRMPPGWDGVETISQLWSVDPDLQVVICTAFSDYSWPEIRQRFGTTDKLLILRKPFDNMEVLQLAHALARKWELTQEARSRLQELDRKVAERTQDLRQAADHVLRLNRLYSVLSNINELIVRSRSLEELCAEACRIAVEDGLFRMAWVGITQPGTSEIKPLAYSGVSGEDLKQIRLCFDAALPEGCGPVGTALREGKHDIRNAVDQDPGLGSWRDYGYRSIAGFPLKVKGRTTGVLALYSLEAGIFNEEEVQLLDRLAADLSFAFEFLDQAQQLKLQGTALESAANGIVITDPQGIILWHNAAFTTLTGYGPTEIIGRNTNVLKSGKHDAAFYGALWKQIVAGRVWRGELINRRKDGSLYNEEMTVTPVKGTEGEITHFVAIKQEITERKRAELRVAAFSSLGQRLSTAKTIKEAAQIVADVADQLLGWDACSCELYFEPDGVVSQVLAVEVVDGQRKEVPISQERKTPSLAAARAIREGGFLLAREKREVTDENSGRLGSFNAASGSLLFVPIRAGERPIGVLSIQSYGPGAYKQEGLQTLQGLADHCAGALERIWAEENLNVTREQLRQSQKLEAIGQLAGGVAHDFNNLLAVIRGNAELIQMDSAHQSGLAGECLSQVVAAADRAATLTRQLLAFSRKQVMQSELLDLNDVIGNLSKMLKRIIGEHMELECRYAAQLPSIRADAGMLEQVLVNLVVNARDAMPRGGQVLISTDSICLDVAYTQQHAEARPGSFVTLTVTDNGEGILPQHVPHVFEPFFTTKEIGKGTGLGLSTVYGIIKQHGGWVEVASERGIGSTFTIFLPATEETPSPGPAVSNQPKPPLRGSETILLVEDEEAVRALTQRILETYGYQVRTANSGAQALEFCQKEKLEINLLLTDVIMPGGLTGRDLAERLTAQNPKLKVIFMSGYSGEVLGSDTDFIRRTDSDFLPKPCSPRELLQTVRESLDRRKDR